MYTVSADEELAYPFVVKSVDGHGGEQVFLATDNESFAQAKEKLKGKTYIKQQLSSDTGRDLRVYSIKGKILAGALRTSDTDFRSNFSLGGKATQVKVPKACKKIVKKLYKELRFDFVGIDFIFNQNKPILNEIEDPVGCRMLYSFGGIDVIKEYLKHISRNIKKGR